MMTALELPTEDEEPSPALVPWGSRKHQWQPDTASHNTQPAWTNPSVSF